MRVLFSSTRYLGHLRPLLPFAWALRRRGHEVLFAVHAGALEAVRKAGINCGLFDGPTEEQFRKVMQRVDAARGAEVTKAVAGGLFADLLARAALPKMLNIVGAWRPDLIIRESAEFSALVAAGRFGVPHARVAINDGRSEAACLQCLPDPLDGLRTLAALNPDQGRAVKAEPIFTAFPAFMDGQTNTTGTCWPFRSRSTMGATAPKQVSQSWTEVNSEPLIYMTFGTVAGRSRKSRLACRAALEAVSALPVRALLSTGRAMNVEELGAIPKNVTVQSWVNPEEVCAHANAIVCHGGSGTVLSGLAAGLPMVIAPLFLNQPNNARSVDAAGAGIAVFDPDSWTLRSAMERVLSDGAMRLAARRIAAEIAEMPSVDDAVDVMLALT